MIQDIAPHTYHNEYKPSARIKTALSLHTKKAVYFFPARNGMQILLSHVSGSWRKRIADLYNNFILSVFHR